MRFVTPKTKEQQILGVYHRARESVISDRVKTSNPIHGFFLKFGVSLPTGQGVLKRLPSVLAEHLLPAPLIVQPATSAQLRRQQPSTSAVAWVVATQFCCTYGGKRPV
ncbi:MAG: hypothetical protein NVSMB6_16510 [Burkholderiaceae bacterium]